MINTLPKKAIPFTLKEIVNKLPEMNLLRWLSEICHKRITNIQIKTMKGKETLIKHDRLYQIANICVQSQ